MINSTIQTLTELADESSRKMNAIKVDKKYD
jgi:hypothetical protein